MSKTKFKVNDKVVGVDVGRTITVQSTVAHGRAVVLVAPDSRAVIEIRGAEALTPDAKYPAPSPLPEVPAAARHRRPRARSATPRCCDPETGDVRSGTTGQCRSARARR